MGWLEDLAGIFTPKQNTWTPSYGGGNSSSYDAYKQNDANKMQAMTKGLNPSNASNPSNPFLGPSGGNDVSSVTPQFVTRQGADDTLESPAPAAPQPNAQTDQIQRLIDTLQQNLGQDPYSSGPYNEAVNSSYKQAFDALQNSQNAIQGNFDTSAGNIKSMYAGGKAAQEGVADQIKQNTADLKNSLNGTWQGAVDSANSAKSAQQAQAANLLQQLGIQSAAGANGQGLHDDSNALNTTIGNLISQKASAADKADTMGNVDLDTNKNQVYGLAGDEMKAQSGLRSQLVQALTGLNSQRANLGAQQAQALAQAKTQSYQDWLGKNSAILGQLDKQQQYALAGQKNDIDRMKAFLQSRVLAAGVTANKGSGLTPIEQANQWLQTQGQDPSKVTSAYTKAQQAYANSGQGSFNPNPSDNYLMNSMIGNGIDPNIAMQYAQLAGMKPTAATMGGGGGTSNNLINYAMMMGMNGGTG